MSRVHEQTVSDAFTRQAESFNRSPVANARQLLDQISELSHPSPNERWLELACGPGIIARRLAPLVAEVHGIDATPAMVELAEREARLQQLGNTSFSQGDATNLNAGDDHFDGVVSRFALHHIPVPARVWEEAHRVVRPGGRVVMVDHLGDAQTGDFAWAQEVERLRDPSHWANLRRDPLTRLGHRAGLELEAERILSMAFDFDDWLTRGQAGQEAARLVGRLIAERPSGTECFRLEPSPTGRMLQLQIWISAWRKPTA